MAEKGGDKPASASASAENQDVDVRLDFISDYISRSLRVKLDKWQKVMATADLRTVVMDFIDNGDSPDLLVFTQSNTGALLPGNEFPANPKSKSIYFMKQESGKPVPKKDIHTALTFGDLSNNPLEQLSVLVDNVLVPLLTNPENQRGWPKVVSQDVEKHIHELQGTIYRMVGQIKGKTLLPMPLNRDHVAEAERKALENGEMVDVELKGSIESMVIKWNSQVDEVLRRDSATALVGGQSPGPMVEVQFWNNRAENLECIYDQMKEGDVKKMAIILEQSRSAYFPAFKAMFRSVVAALTEAQDICLHMRPLVPQIEAVECADLTDVDVLLRPLVHTVCLIWANSRYYSTPGRIIVLLQEICNMVIQTSRVFLDPGSIFQAEAEEAVQNVYTTLRMLKLFRHVYEEYKEKLPKFFPSAELIKLWEFQPELVFSRFNRFFKRLETIKEFFETSLEFIKLEKVEIGGIRGKALSSEVVVVFDQFNEYYAHFANQSYDSLDPDDESFVGDYQTFEARILDLDRRLATCVCQAFDDCVGSEATFKLFTMCGTLLDRPVIAEDFKPKYSLLLATIHSELDEAKVVYDKQMALVDASGAQLGQNMPLVAGMLKWIAELKGRVENTISNFRGLEHPVVECDSARHLYVKYDDLMRLLLEREVAVYDGWQKGVAEKIGDTTRLSLVVRHHHTVHSNFDPQLVSILREVKYLRQLGREDIPEEAGKMDDDAETYRQYTSNLELICTSYNSLRENTLPVEFKLIEGQVKDIDVQLDMAVNELTWTSPDIWEYIQTTRDMVMDLSTRVEKSQKNIQIIKDMLLVFTTKPLFERKEDRINTLLNLEDKEEKLKKTYGAITKCGEKIHRLVRENKVHLKADGKSRSWRHYVHSIDDIVVQEFVKVVQCSLGYLLDNTDLRVNTQPLMECRLELIEPDVLFKPSLDYQDEGGFLDITEGVVTDIFNMSTLVKKLSRKVHQHSYLEELEETEQLSEMRCLFMTNIHSVIVQATEYQQSLDQHSYLWTDDRADFMTQFLRYGHQVTSDEIEQFGDDGIPESPPALSQFQEQIDSYEKLYVEMEKVEPVVTFDTWFRLDCKPFKAALLNTIKRWSLLFKQYLIDHVTDSLQGLADFIQSTDTGLLNQVQEGNYQGLVTMMAHLMAVKERQEVTSNMFEPLKQTIELLKTYDVEMAEEIHLQLQELPEKWKNTLKLGIQAKQQVAPLQANEVANVRRSVAAFEIKQFEYREAFRKLLVFSYECTTPYEILDNTHLAMRAMELELAKITASAALFEVQISDFKQLKLCRKEAKLAKHLWDQVFMVRSCIDDWKKTTWKNINVENMDIECKKFSKDVRGMDKEVRAWNTYSELEDTVKNMLTSLKAVAELQNTAIRTRHWKQLMIATKVKFVMDENTTLADLLALHLHEFEDEVKNIVDKAVKEMSMEKVLKELDGTWSTMEFEHDKHDRTSLQLLRASEELIETLEDNQVQLQNLMTSKYISFFLEEVSTWQKKLSMADQVITIWFEVQRTWSHLESIFIGSEDIRKQLPEDSKRFDEIDDKFKVLVGDINVTSNVVGATNQDGLFDRLEALQGQLTLCEKALAEYLETKRLAFPRFYFVSSADLLDILSNGNQPELVAKHLTKLFDSMAKLKFKDGSGTVALGMWAKDGEYIDFDEDINCVGAVEQWLNKLLQRMRATVRHYMTEAVASYEDKPREQWLFDYVAQVSLAGTQIWWATEVNISFSRLEEGYENALKDYNKKQVSQLNALIALLVGDLTKQERQKITTICTIDVHSRDVVGKLIAAKVESAQAFSWQAQLRHRWDDAAKDCYANICDAQLRYSHEYLGNSPRLVITPLTDRCYITLTQSLHLVMGGAPAGPAGTGKTETTKDLGKAVGIMVYVFNCSEQMDYKSCGNIYKGLAQTGAWGCFDEFNRISVEVLSVVAVQVKTVQDAIRDKKERFNFMGDEILCVPSVGLFITMNPGYAGRTELPENLKALFRPCAMVVPDIELICEIMLVSEGFIDSRLLARKFITLYTLCKELLSKQDHYDWGLRAVKSVLVVAGSLKRSDRGRPEDQVLMRALRDFNVPKIVTDDVPVFLGLIFDLFPALDVPRKRDMDFEKSVKKACMDLRLQPEDGFTLKVVQLKELLDVRHSVFIIGNAGTGKTNVWKTLFKTHQNLKQRPAVIDLNPKAVTNDELFGVINQSTREWKDGLLSSLMRDMANLTTDGPRWIILDGDIDPMWIESLNTVMDDNKVLTLASNERIALTPSMRLLFEIATLRHATPATVSRAGILYLNPQDLGWNPFVSSWIETREIQSEKANLMILFDKYVPGCLEVMRSRLKKITPIAEISQIQLLCSLLDCMLTPETVPADSPKELYEMYFCFCCVSAFGASMFQDQMTDYRVEFSRWWISEFKSIKFPVAGTVFDYYIDRETQKFVPWSQNVPTFDLDPDMPLQAVQVATPETTRLRFFMDKLMEKRHPVMLVGPPGSGKTVLINDKLSHMPDEYMVTRVPFNFYTTSEMLQRVLEKPLEKKAGRNYGPPGSKKMIYFVDDMNMPEVDLYDTVQPHTMMRQHLDYNHWYDRIKLSLKEIHNVQYVAAMNPTAGSFTINPRLQRHFAVFATSFPGAESLYTIYNSILHQHLSNPLNKFPHPILKMSTNIVQSAFTLHQKVSQSFLPTAVKFHYVFNLRDLSNIFQGLLFCGSEAVKTPLDLIRVWIHESNRVYGDKLVDSEDGTSFQKIMLDIAKKGFEDQDETLVMAKPNIWCHFAKGIGDPKYFQITDWTELSRLLKEGIDSYNDINAAMNLVLFEDAMRHICRINRILESPRGNALLVGVGGSGKQSLSRLAAFISGLEVFQVTLKKGYGIPDLKLDLAALYQKAGLKNVGMVFLMTDSQVADEKFLVLINDLLASGEIPDLFADDELENIIAAVRNEVKAAGMEDTRDNCWRFFIDKVRRTLKVVLCFSPVGTTLRVRSRKFPALINCTNIDWFHEWPQEALVSVSQSFLKDVRDLTPELAVKSAEFMSFVHVSVNEMSKIYLANDKRYNYTTPKSFLEQIALYSKLLSFNVGDLAAKIDRLENGLEKLRNTSSQVDDLKDKLASQEVELKIKNADADRLIQVVGKETETVTKEKNIADEEEKKVGVIAIEVGKKQRECEADLAKAEPALLAAQEALNTLNKNNLTELKSFGTPPPAVVNVTAAVMVLLAPGGKVARDRSWKACKVMMAKVDGFLEELRTYDKEHVPAECLKAIRPYLADPQFTSEFISSKSLAAAGLCAWVVNIIKFYEVYCEVEPKRLALGAANAELAAASEKLAQIKDRVVVLEETLGKLTADFEEATAAKVKCQKEADSTAYIIDLANRLVGGLASENVRWGESVAKFKEQETTIPGDVLLVTAFISYVGCFTKQYRTELLEKLWFPKINKLEIPTTPELDPLSMLTDEAQIATWNNEGLPNDRMSAENATILTKSERWPLMIDPQLQGVKWIKTRYGDELKVIRLGQRGYMDVVEQAISDGSVVLLENIEESVDPVLDPLLARNLIRKGTAIKLGDKEVEYNPEFRLILHTKLANPHYKPEMQAQTTLINFTVTRDGLEDQLLAEVVKSERPDLEEQKYNLTKQQNEFKILLKKLEDNLLSRLSSAGGNFLGDTELVENLEYTKKTAAEVQDKVIEGRETTIKIDEARELYRAAATRASLLYFILNDLHKINPIYQFSLKAFTVVFHKAMSTADPAEDVKGRVDNLIDSVTYSVFMYTTRGLFECDKLIFTAQMAFQILLTSKEIQFYELDFLLRFPITPNVTSPVDFLTNVYWGAIKSLSAMEDFKNLDRDIEGSAKRWKTLCESECPEKEKFPQEWKNKTALQRLCMMRALRPDRMTYAVRGFIDERMGFKYIEGRTVEFTKSFEESGPSTPIFFILSPGVDPLKDVEKLGRKLKFTFDHKNFHSVSLGQGQEVVAEDALEIAAKHGHWVILQNIHLVKNWLPRLEKKLETNSTAGHRKYRVFMSAEPAGTPDAHIIPQGILESAIKITNEPPTGMFANLHKALDNFNQDTVEMCTKEAEFKSILFSLCYFHAVVAERRKFGPQGWNRPYPFNVGDLTISVNVLFNYLEANNKVPWEDLRYLFGEIMYGGHITDDWDRRLCRTYLEVYMHPDQLEGDLFFAPGFPSPPNSDYKGYHTYINDMLPPESPYLYGLHPNAEIGFLTATSNNLFRTVFELQPRDSGGGSGVTVTREEKVKQILDDIVDKLPDEFNMVEIMGKVEDRTPYVVVAFQECERMNMLTGEIRRSLKELDLGLKGELTITNDMEDLGNSLFMDSVATSWGNRAYPSMNGLTVWYMDLLLRVRELENWTSDFQLPASVWLAGFFNPQSFLTAIMQSTARKNEWPLDRMCLQCDVTKKNKEDFSSAPREGAYVHGLFMEGARWDTGAGSIVDSKLKELYPLMPVIFIRAMTQDKQDTRNIYECPVYKTRMRGPTFVWTFNLKTKEKASKWVLAGVALLLQI